MAEPRGDLSVTALYTSHTWVWAGLSSAQLLAHPEARRVFQVTNFVLGLARLFRRTLPSLPHSLVQRHLLIDRLLERFLDRTPGAQILELAAGLSQRGSAFSANPGLRYVELDLEPVMARKRTLLARTAEGREVLARTNLQLVTADIETAELASLRSSSAPLAIIVEGLLMYLQPHAQRRLWTRLRALLPPDQSGLLVFDLVPTCEQPRPGFIGMALEWLMKRFTKGRAFERDDRTRTDLIAELNAAGFTQVEALDAAEVAESYDLPFRDIRTQQLVFACRP